MRLKFWTNKRDSDLEPELTLAEQLAAERLANPGRPAS